MKRAPAETWGLLTDLLRSLEVGERGVLRVPVEVLHCRRCGYVVEDGELSCPECGADTCADRLPLGQIVDLLDNDSPVISPPLRPGRYWVPEEWWCSRVGLGETGLWKFEYRQRGVRPWPARVVRMDDGWMPADARDWRSPWHLPARAARLACEVGEAEVKPWCEECEGDAERRLYDGPGFAGYRLVTCPTCSGEPGPWCVYDIKRIEVSDD